MESKINVVQGRSRQNFFMIYNDLIDLYSGRLIDNNGLALYAILSRYVNNVEGADLNGWSYPTKLLLIDKMKIGKTTLETVIDQLVKADLIEVSTIDQWQKFNVPKYVFKVHAPLNKESFEAKFPSEQTKVLIRTDQSSSQNLGQFQSEHKKDKDKKTKEKDNNEEPEAKLQDMTGEELLALVEKKKLKVSEIPSEVKGLYDVAVKRKKFNEFLAKTPSEYSNEDVRMYFMNKFFSAYGFKYPQNLAKDRGIIKKFMSGLEDNPELAVLVIDEIFKKKADYVSSQFPNILMGALGWITKKIDVQMLQKRLNNSSRKTDTNQNGSVNKDSDDDGFNPFN